MSEKKVNSKKSGKWLCMSDDFGMVGSVLVKEDYPERLGYKMIQESFDKSKEVLGDDYHTLDSDKYSKGFRPEFKELSKKFNNPASFDKLYSANLKVALAKEKMASNLPRSNLTCAQFYYVCMDNSTKLEVNICLIKYKFSIGAK